MSGLVRYEAAQGIATVTLDRPEQRNAVNAALADELRAALARLEADPDIRVGVLTGAGRVFCAGMDLKAFLDGEGEAILFGENRFAGFVDAPRSKPLIAAVNGAALAGGLEIALACDLIVAEEGAVFGLPEVRVGIFALAGGPFRLARRIPPARALELALTGGRIDAGEAHVLGLVNRLARPGEVLDAALALAHEIAANAPLGVAATLAILRRALMDRDAALFEHAESLWPEVAASQDAVEGPRAFAEKRAPVCPDAERERKPVPDAETTRERKAGGRRARAARAGGGIPQLPWREVENPHAPMDLAAPEQIDAIHDTSIRILKELGIRVLNPRVLDLFAAAGASVDREEGTIRLGEDLVAGALGTAPATFTLGGSNPGKRLTIGGRHVAFGLVAGPPNVHDCVNGRRPGNLADYRDLIRLAHHFNAIHLIGNQVTAPQELPANNRHLDTYLANLTLCDLSFHCTAIGRGRAIDGIEMMAIARGLTLEEMAHDPGVITIISVNSPRLFDGEMAEGLMAMAEHGQPVVITPFTLMGAMTPVTLPAAMAQQNAEALFGVVLTQLVNPGAPVMYGAFTSNVDMRSGAPAFGTPENTKANIIAGQLARRYRLPYRTSNANASNTVDLQAAYETTMATWGAVMGGGNIVYHAAGWLEGGLTASFEKLILDVEILQNMMEILRPVEFSEEDLGFDAIASVPTGGHFFGAAHTLARYQTAFYTPMLSDWTNHGAWEAAGSKDALTRATGLWQRALAEYQEPAMDPGIAEALDAYVARRKEAIGAGEP